LRQDIDTRSAHNALQDMRNERYNPRGSVRENESETICGEFVDSERAYNGVVRVK